MSRKDKVAEAIKKEISSIIVYELKDPRIGFVTITQVELTPDLRMARVFFSVLGGDDDYARTSQAFDSALGFIRRRVGERINLRLVPEIIFKPDKSAAYSVRIQEILDEIKSSKRDQKSRGVRKKQE